ncbi:hypothetical protein CPL00188L_CDS0025 [Escherichia phage WaterSpirit]
MYIDDFTVYCLSSWCLSFALKLRRCEFDNKREQKKQIALFAKLDVQDRV